MSVYHLDCCTVPDHVVSHSADAASDDDEAMGWWRWECRNCHTWWTPQEYADAAAHDEALDRAEKEFFEYGTEGVSATN